MTYQNILLYPNQRRPVNKEDFEKVSTLLHGMGYTLFTTDPSFVTDEIHYLPAETAFSKCDAAIVLGGDGTMLGAASRARLAGTPLLGINFGTLGYMTELEISECHLLAKLGQARIEERMLLDVTARGDAVSPITITALNEAVISHAAPGAMIRLRLFCDGNEVCSYRGDGMIISTPTGSSAYNLSVGGPIIDPKMNAFCVAPMAPHTLAAMRPLIFSPDSVLQVEIEGDVNVTADSELFPLLKGKSVLTVKQSADTLKLLKLKNAGFYEALMKKLT